MDNHGFRFVTSLIIALLVPCLGRAAEPGSPLLDANLPGGNIIIEKVEGNTFFLKPDLRDTQEGRWWFYWNFRVKNAGGRTLNFRFTEHNPTTVSGPAVSRDGGLTWGWLGADAVRKVPDQKAWEFSFPFPDDKEVRFGFAIPYVQADLERFLGRHRGHPSLKVDQLCRSRKGRRVECLRLGKIRGQPKYRVLLTARHHACESLASYELEGIMEAVLAETPEGRAWREQIDLMVIPFMDKDGVEDGDQGKLRAPHDHNRDYEGRSIYPEVAALRKRVPGWLKGKPVFAMDMHCPYLRDEQIFLAGGTNQMIWSQVLEFSRRLESAQQAPFHYRLEDNYPYGKGWNVASQLGPGRSMAGWAAELPNAKFAATLEFPYAMRAVEVNPESARSFGGAVARTILEFLKQEK